MIVSLKSVAVSGLDGSIIDVEVDTHKTNKPLFALIGLGDAAIQEAKDRLKPAIKNSGLTFPVGKKITVNLAPADLKKKGPAFDLAIAVGIVATEQEIPEKFLKTSIFLGELALEGHLRSVAGILPSVLAAKSHGFERVFVPTENAQEASLVSGIDIIAVSSLRETIDRLTGEMSMTAFVPANLPDSVDDVSLRIPDFSEVVGQDHAKRALTIAAAGGHNILLQ